MNQKNTEKLLFIPRLVTVFTPFKALCFLIRSTSLCDTVWLHLHQFIHWVWILALCLHVSKSCHDIYLRYFFRFCVSVFTLSFIRNLDLVLRSFPSLITCMVLLTFQVSSHFTSLSLIVYCSSYPLFFLLVIFFAFLFFSSLFCPASFLSSLLVSLLFGQRPRRGR